MGLRWSTSANRDLHPRIGARLGEFDPREVRRLIVGDHEIRYEAREDELIILRIWHVYEDR
jgi:hypothetical protein